MLWGWAPERWGEFDFIWHKYYATLQSPLSWCEMSFASWKLKAPSELWKSIVLWTLLERTSPNLITFKGISWCHSTFLWRSNSAFHQRHPTHPQDLQTTQRMSQTETSTCHSSDGNLHLPTEINKQRLLVNSQILELFRYNPLDMALHHLAAASWTCQKSNERSFTNFRDFFGWRKGWEWSCDLWRCGVHPD